MTRKHLVIYSYLLSSYTLAPNFAGYSSTVVGKYLFLI